MTSTNQPFCSATTRAGQPCRNRAIRGLDPPLCHAHAPRDSGAWNAPRACSAATRRGQPCKAPAIKGSDPPLCCAHAGRAKPLWPPAQRCTARISNHRRLGHEICRGRAVPGSDPPLCANHAGLTSLPPKITCSAKTKSGAPCRAPASANTNPPLCAIHSGHGGFQLEHTHTPLYGGQYAIVPRRRFWEQWALVYNDFFAAEEYDLSWQKQVIISRFAYRHFLAITREDHDLDPYEFTRAMLALDFGIKTVINLFEANKPRR